MCMGDFSGTYLDENAYQVTITPIENVTGGSEAYQVQYPPDPSRGFAGRGPFQGLATEAITVNFTDENQTIRGVASAVAGGAVQKISFETGGVWSREPTL